MLYNYSNMTIELPNKKQFNGREEEEKLRKTSGNEQQKYQAVIGTSIEHTNIYEQTREKCWTLENASIKKPYFLKRIHVALHTLFFVHYTSKDGCFFSHLVSISVHSPFIISYLHLYLMAVVCVANCMGWIGSHCVWYARGLLCGQQQTAASNHTEILTNIVSIFEVLYGTHRK